MSRKKVAPASPRTVAKMILSICEGRAFTSSKRVKIEQKSEHQKMAKHIVKNIQIFTLSTYPPKNTD